MQGAKKGPTAMGPLPQHEADIPREVPTREESCSIVAFPYVESNSHQHMCRGAAGDRQQHMLSELEHQYYAGIRRKDGRTVGLGL